MNYLAQMKGKLMKIFSFLRKPLKLYLYGTLLALLCTVTLIFALQYQTDKKTLADWLSNYTYVGTISPDVEKVAALSPLSEETKNMLKEADTIASLHSFQTYGARLSDGHLVPDQMMTLSQLQQRYFVQAKVTGVRGSETFGDFKYDRYSIEIVKEWGSSKIGDRGFFLHMLRLAEESAFAAGDEIFFTCGYYIDSYGFIKVVEFEFYTPAAYEVLMGVEPADIFTQNPYLVLEEGEGEAEIWKFMEETGLAPYYEKFTELGQNLAVRAVSDFYGLPKTATDRVYVTDGRGITQEDTGKKVCMISQNLANRNRYCIGDRITLKIADESYSLYGWENGNPMPEDALITSYGESEEYEIIGVYNQISRNDYDPFYYSHTDIFIPTIAKTEEIPLPYAFSFKVLGVDYDAFLAETLPDLEATGCIVKLADTGWQDVEDAYYAMEVRCGLMFCCAILAFVAAVMVFAILLFFHLRKEYGLMRLMGAYRHEACQVYIAAVTVIAVPALMISGIMGYVIVKYKMAAAIISNLAIFVMLPVALLMAICLVLFLLIAFSERGSVRKIIL